MFIADDYILLHMLDRKNRTILAIGAHPDDIEMGCGGTLAKLKKDGAEIYTAIMTKCEDECTKKDSDTRIKEYYAAVKILGVKKAFAFDFPNRHLPKHEIDITDEFSRLQEQIKPDLIFCPYLDDSHQDHSAVARSAVRSFRKDESIIQYEILRYGSHTFTPNLFVDITKYMPIKLKMLACHASQKERRAYFDEESFKGLARTRGAQAGYDYAEGFVIYKMLW